MTEIEMFEVVFHGKGHFAAAASTTDFMTHRTSLSLDTIELMLN
jgi:hypothetical protein